MVHIEGVFTQIQTGCIHRFTYSDRMYSHRFRQGVFIDSNSDRVYSHRFTDCDRMYSHRFTDSDGVFTQIHRL